MWTLIIINLEIGLSGGGDFNEILQIMALRIDLVSAVVVHWRFNIHVLVSKLISFTD